MRRAHFPRAFQCFSTPDRTFIVGQPLTQDSTLVLHGLPFKAGESVEVVIRQEPAVRPEVGRYPLRGVPIRYIDPTEPVAQADWEAAQ